MWVILIPQAVTSAIDFAERGGDSILDNERFQQMRQAVGDAPASSVSFVDLEQTVPNTWQGPLLVGQLASSMGIAMAPADDGAAIAVLPPLGRLPPLLEPAGQVAWSDDEGWHLRSTSPFRTSRSTRYVMPPLETSTLR